MNYCFKNIDDSIIQNFLTLSKDAFIHYNRTDDISSCDILVLPLPETQIFHDIYDSYRKICHHQLIIFMTDKYHIPIYILKDVFFFRTDHFYEDFDTFRRLYYQNYYPYPSITVPDGTKTTTLIPDKILSIEVRSHYLYIRYYHQVIKIRCSLKEIQNYLPHQFIRCHHSFIINAYTIYKKDSHKVLLGYQEHEVPIGYKYRKSFNDLYQQLYYE